MEVTTKEQAEEAIDAICKWLAYSDSENKAVVAQDFAFEILGAAEIDNGAGCPLCGG